MELAEGCPEPVLAAGELPGAGLETEDPFRFVLGTYFPLAGAV